MPTEQYKYQEDSDRNGSGLLPMYIPSSAAPTGKDAGKRPPSPKSMSRHNRTMLVTILIISTLMILLWFFTHSSVVNNDLFVTHSRAIRRDLELEQQSVRLQIERREQQRREQNQQQQQQEWIDVNEEEEEGHGNQQQQQQQHDPTWIVDPINEDRKQSVVRAMQHAWEAYGKHAWGHDELKPHSRRGKDWVSGGGMAMTIVDALDTLWIMGLKEEFHKGVDYVVNSLRKFNTINTSTSVFETVIRMVGGLITAYELSGERSLLDRAKEMGDTLMPAFKSDIPYAHLNFKTGAVANPQWTGRNALLAEFMTIQLEFRRLSQLTGEDKYDRVATRVMDVMETEQNKRSDGLWPLFYSEQRRAFTNEHLSLGAMGDSAYEYLLKQWLMSNKRDKRYLDMYIKAAKGIEQHLFARTTPSNFLYLVDKKGGRVDYKMDHLACFAGGMFALAAHEGACENTEHCEKQLQWGKELTKTCYESYRRQPSGLGPEVMHFPPGKDISAGVKGYILRPETIESIFILYRVTGDPMYREWGWEMFQAIEKNCKVPHGGYSGVRDVTRDDNSVGNHDDVMQTFFLSETLKYFYLLFSSNDVISLDEWVFNTECHPLRIEK